MWRVDIRKKIEEDGTWKGSVNTDRANFKEFMREIRNDIKEINGKISQIFSRLPADVATSQSPIRLTDLGRDISKNVEATAWVNKVYDTVQGKVKGQEAYEVQQFSFKYADNDDHYTEEERIRIRKVAYDVNGISENEVRQVLGIELRDKLLSMMSIDAP